MPGRQMESLTTGLAHSNPSFVNSPFSSSIDPTTTTPSRENPLAPSPSYFGTFIPTTQSDASRQLVLGQAPGSTLLAQTSDGIIVPQEMVLGSAQESRLYGSTSGRSCDDTCTSTTALDIEVELSSTRQVETRTKSEQITEAVQGTSGLGALPNSSKSLGHQKRLKYVLPEDPRKRRIVELNRIAAVKCRLRKRNEVSALVSQEKILQDHNRYLSIHVESLTAEVYVLKAQLLQHTHCNCTLIHKYIAIETKRTSNDFSSYFAPLQFYNESTGVCHQHRSNSDISFSSTPDALTPGYETMPSPWAQVFQADFASSEKGEGMHGRMIVPYNEGLLPMHSQPTANNTSLALTRKDTFVEMVPRPRSPDGTSWRSSEELLLADRATGLPIYESPSITPETTYLV